MENFHLKFTVICQQCISDVTIENPQNEIIIALNFMLNASFRCEFLEQAMLMLPKNPIDLLEQEKLDNLKKKLESISTESTSSESELIEDLICLLNSFPQAMGNLIPKYRLHNTNLESSQRQRLEKLPNREGFYIMLGNSSNITYAPTQSEKIEASEVKNPSTSE